MSPSESSALRITFTTCPIARSVSSTSSAVGEEQTASPTASTTGPACIAQVPLS